MKERAALVLAAGEGKRMRSSLPKVLHVLMNRTLIEWVLEAVGAAGFPRVIVVVGHGGGEVRRAVSRPEIEFVRQEEQKGTGHAVLQAEPLLGGFGGSLVVLSGDVPFVRPETLEGLVRLHEERGGGATVATAEMPDPAGYGRIVRDGRGGIDRIVEEKDATDEERKIREINSGTYAFDSKALFDALPRVGAENASGEIYLTDVVAILRGEGRSVLPYPVGDRWEIFGINTPEHLEAAAEHAEGRNHG
ncbi:MAG: NTP transferase domain-containing protein [Candidatus Eisenbacteria bacterium]